MVIGDRVWLSAVMRFHSMTLAFVALAACSEIAGESEDASSVDRSDTPTSTDAGPEPLDVRAPLDASDGSSDAGSSRPITPALIADPEILAILDALGDNESALLPPIRTVGEWNDVALAHRMDERGPNGRNYSHKAVWMPDRERAFFCGANHGSPHRLNDAWEHDLPSNTWVMLFAPDPNNGQGVIRIHEGVIRGGEGVETVHYVATERGGPTHLGHTWWGLTYDPVMRAALWMNVPISSSAGRSTSEYLMNELGEEASIFRGPPLWAFYPHEQRWELVLSQSPYPRAPYAGAMEYVPELGGAFWYSASSSGSGMHVYSPSENAWRNLAPNGGANIRSSTETPRPESVMCFNRTHGVVVAQSPTRRTYHYDIAMNAWSMILDTPADSSLAPEGHDSHAQMFFDPQSGACLLYEEDRRDGIWSYDVEARAWTRNIPDGPPVTGAGRVISYVDEARNVLVVNLRESTWVYRFRSAD